MPMVFFDLTSFLAISSIGLVAFDKENEYHFIEAILFVFLVKYKGANTVRMKVARCFGYTYIALLLYFVFL